MAREAGRMWRQTILNNSDDTTSVSLRLTASPEEKPLDSRAKLVCISEIGCVHFATSERRIEGPGHGA